MKKIDTYLICFWFTFVSLITLCFYGMYRNNMVLSYRDQLSIQSIFVDIDYHDEFVDNIYKRYSYMDMFLSFRPMKSKYWFTNEEIEKYELERVDEASKLF